MAKQEALPSGTVGAWPSSPGTAERSTLWPAVSPSSVSSGSREVEAELDPGSSRARRTPAIPWASHPQGQSGSQELWLFKFQGPIRE